MTTFRKVSVFSACCTYCGDDVVYTVTDEHMPLFEQIDASCDHRAFCQSCDFYRQEDLLSAFRRDSKSQPGQPAQIKPL